MKRIFGILLMGWVVLTAAPVWSADTYLSGNLGFAFRPDSKLTGSSGKFDNDPALILNGAIGTTLQSNLRVEAELAYHTNKADRTTTSQDFNFSVLSLMGNAYIDIINQSKLTPFFGAGLGLGSAGASEDWRDSSDSDIVVTGQLMGGVAYDISPKASLTFQYRYFRTTDPAFNLNGPGFFETEFISHDFLFGARFWF